jgi:DNA-binding CsgD family transcriptional regulator
VLVDLAAGSNPIVEFPSHSGTTRPTERPNDWAGAQGSGVFAPPPILMSSTAPERHRQPSPGDVTPDVREGEALSSDDLAETAAQVLDDCPLPALVLEIPAERIVVASPAAAALLDPDGGGVVGRLLEDFTADRPTPGGDLFAGGRLNGFETFRVLRRAHGADVTVRMWVRTFDHQPSSRLVLVVIVVDRPTGTGGRSAGWPEAPAVIGMADADLMIERISDDAETMFGRPVAELLGRSLLGLVSEADVSNCLAALAEASATQNGVTLYLTARVTDNDGVEVGALESELLILPLRPSPSCAFVFLPTPVGLSRPNVSSDLPAMLARLSRGAEVAQLARGVLRGITDRDVPGLNRLTTRELEVVARLVEGDRVPAIASALFLSQSTIRNHLASVFTKLGITSQQQLLTLLRAKRLHPSST